MTRDDVIRMARQAGMCGMLTDVICQFSELEHFARLVAAAEREACAKVCDEMGEHWGAFKDTALLNGDVTLSNAASGEPRAAKFLAATIRARSQP